MAITNLRTSLDLIASTLPAPPTAALDPVVTSFRVRALVVANFRPTAAP